MSKIVSQMPYATGIIRGAMYRSATSAASFDIGVFGIIKLTSKISRGIYFGQSITIKDEDNRTYPEEE